MDIKEYIGSGSIESYVLGLSSKEEQVEFEQLCLEHPELVTVRNSFELSLEKLAFENVVEPPAFLKQRFVDFFADRADNPSKVVQMESSTTTTKKSSGVRWLAAASVILLLVSGFLAYRFYKETVALKSELQETKVTQAGLDDRLRTLEEHEKVVTNPNVAVVSLTPMPKKVPATADIYWDSTSSNVYLIVKNMPKLPSDKQYQLWALIDGKPKDLGLFDIKEDNKGMFKMNNTQKADAFAITIENRGNTGGPNLEQLQTMGKIKL